MKARQIEKRAKESYRKRVSSCLRKHRHPDEITARAAAMDAIQKYHNVEKLHVYHCPVCSGWHLSKKGDDTAITEENPFDENIAAHEDFLSIIKTGPITTISEQVQQFTAQEIWLYNLCLELEKKDKIYRSNVRDNTIEWKYKRITSRKEEYQNKEEVF
jgi:hypothetical protein